MDTLLEWVKASPKEKKGPQRWQTLKLSVFQLIEIFIGRESIFY